MPLKLNIRETLAFFDEDKSAGKHSNALKSVFGEELCIALLLEYLTRQDPNTARLTGACTTGNRSGHQLDAWIMSTLPGAARPTYFQTEVKSWSFHGVGPGTRPLPLNVEASELAIRKKESWKDYWSGTGFHNTKLDKVFTKMKPPLADVVVAPLACLWAAVHDKGLDDPLFQVSGIARDPFTSVYVFSASSYLRLELRASDFKYLVLKHVPERLDYLRRVFPQ